MKRQSNSRAGFTMLELSISITILATVVLAATMAVDRSQGAWSTTIRTDDQATVAQVALDRVARDLASGLRASLAPATTLPGQSTSTLDYRDHGGWVGGAVVPGVLNRIGFELDPAELNDGIDNDSDGLVDEGALVWRGDPGGPNAQRIVHAHRVAALLEGELPNGLDDNGNGLVDEPGFCIQITGNTLNLRLTLERRNPDGALLTSTVETSVLVRN